MEDKTPSNNNASYAMWELDGVQVFGSFLNLYLSLIYQSFENQHGVYIQR